MNKTALCFLIVLMMARIAAGEESEVLPTTNAKVYIREHPQTGRLFVSIRTQDLARDPFKGFIKREIRPNYKMLEANAKGIPYEGPISDRKKVYIFAASMMTLGIAGGIVTAALPATAAASGGTGFLGVGAVSLTAGTAGTIAVKSHISPGEENYVHDSETTSVGRKFKSKSFREIIHEIDTKEEKAEL